VLCRACLCTGVLDSRSARRAGSRGAAKRPGSEMRCRGGGTATTPRPTCTCGPPALVFAPSLPARHPSAVDHPIYAAFECNVGTPVTRFDDTSVPIVSNLHGNPAVPCTSCHHKNFQLPRDLGVNKITYSTSSNARLAFSLLYPLLQLFAVCLWRTCLALRLETLRHRRLVLTMYHQQEIDTTDIDSL
jgi:hypothetical protein